MRRNLNRILIILGVLALGSAVFAVDPSFYTTGNPDDTPDGTQITAESTDNTIGYDDVDGNLIPTVEVSGGDIETAVTDENGFSMLRAVDDQPSLTPGQVFTHETYSMTNEGNVTDTYTVESMYFERNYAQAWTVLLVSAETDATIATLTPGVLNVYTRGVADNDDLAVYYRITVSDEASGAPDGASIEVFTTFETSATPVGQYTGGNAYTYGGTSEADDVFLDSVSAPTMIISRVSLVDSPDNYTGGADDIVPGAVATMTFTYTNEGSAAAQEVIIVSRIPTLEGVSGTNLAHVNGADTRGNVTITPVAGTATGWDVSYATSLTAATTYGATIDWTPIGSVGPTQYPPGGLYLTSSNEYAAVLIKWEKESVANGEDDTLTWGVTIR